MDHSYVRVDQSLRKFNIFLEQNPTLWRGEWEGGEIDESLPKLNKLITGFRAVNITKVSYITDNLLL